MFQGGETLVLKDIRNTYQVTFRPENGEEDGVCYVLPPESGMTLPEEPARPGYAFTGWSDGVNTYDAGAAVSITADAVFTAQWSRISSGGGGAPSSYGVTASADGHGSVAVDPTRAARGTFVTVTVRAEEGYVLQALTVRDAAGGEVAVTEEDGRYTFTMPGGPVTVSAVFQKEVSPLPFTDVGEGQWFYEAVRYAYEAGMMSGVGGGRFAPDDNLTRAMLCQVLYRLAGSPAAGGGAFADVADGAWYAGAVSWATANGIVSGYGGGLFGPEDAITREQIALILRNYAAAQDWDVSARGDVSAFGDGADVSAWASSAMEWAVGAGLLQGYDGNLYSGDTATRAEVAQILMNFCEYIAQ